LPADGRGCLRVLGTVCWLGTIARNMAIAASGQGGAMAVAIWSARAIVALVENGFITGVVLPCDGGLRLA